MAIICIVVLLAGVIAVGYLYLQESNKLKVEAVKLKEAQSSIVALEGDVSALQTKLTESEATVSALETELETANDEMEDLQADVTTQQQLNSSLSEELKKIQYPRHFKSVQELTDWLHEDETDTEYAHESDSQMCYILMVKALRDGYLLPVSVYEEGDYIYACNSAVIGDTVYDVWPWDDSSTFFGYVYPVPSYPLSFD